MSKNIVLCLDGTGTGRTTRTRPARDADERPEAVRVAPGGSAPVAAGDQEKERRHATDGTISQVGKYIYGVGATGNELAQACQGAVGLGLVGAHRARLHLPSRKYEPGEASSSSGSAAAPTPALAGRSRHAPGPARLEGDELVAGSQESYSAGLAAWQEYKKTIYKNKGTVLQEVARSSARCRQLPARAASLARACSSPGRRHRGGGRLGHRRRAGHPRGRQDQELDGACRRLPVLRHQAQREGGERLPCGGDRRAARRLHADAVGRPRRRRPGAVPRRARRHRRRRLARRIGPVQRRLAWMARQVARWACSSTRCLPAGEPRSLIQHQPWTDSLLGEDRARQFPPGLRLSLRVLQRIAARQGALEWAHEAALPAEEHRQQLRDAGLVGRRTARGAV